MDGEVRSVVLNRSLSGGFGFSILGGSGSELPPVVYDIVDGSPASDSGELEAGDVILEVNNQEVTGLTTKEVLKCLRLSDQRVSLKLQRDDVIKQRVRAYLESPQTLERLRPAITQRDLHHVKDVVAMKTTSPAPRRGAPEVVPRVPLMHSPPKGRARPLPPPGEERERERERQRSAPHTNGHGQADVSRPRFETFTMTGEMMLNLSRTPAGEAPPMPPPSLSLSGVGGGSAPTSPPSSSASAASAAAVAAGGGGFRGSRSEDRLLTTPGDELAEELAGSLDPLLDTDADRSPDSPPPQLPHKSSRETPTEQRNATGSPGTSPASNRLNDNGPESAEKRTERSAEKGSERGLDKGSERSPSHHADPSPDLSPDRDTRAIFTANSPSPTLNGGTTTIASTSNTTTSNTTSNTTSPSSSGGVSPESEDGSDSESLQSFHFTQKAVDVPSAVRLAKRLYQLEGFRRSDVSRHLSKNNDFSRAVAEEYVKHFDFTGCTLDAALSQFLERFALTGETQERERVLVHFSRRYMDNNPRAFNSPDACHTLTCALMLLNTDLHVQHVPRKMTCAEFVDNLSELNDGEDFPVDTLRRLYQAIRARPIHYATDDEYEEMQAVPATDLPSGGGVTNPFLAPPDPSKATEYKRGYMMRKCCLDPGGKRTALGRRSWQMYHCTLRDLVLYLHKDESGSRRQAAFDHLHNAIRVHHALASKAEEYLKKQHVFRLQTADQAEYLLQTSDAKELQSWVDTINFVAASLSAPPLPGAVGSQRRFQRPLLPSGVTPHSLHDQLQGHELRLADIERELAEMESAETTKQSNHQRHYHRHKSTFLQSEAIRYRTYCQLLRSKMAAEPPPVPSAPLAAVAAVSPPLSADRGRPARPTDRGGAVDEVAPAPEVTKEQRLLTKKQHRPTPEVAETSVETILETSGETPKETLVETAAEETVAKSAAHTAKTNAQADTVVKEAHGTNGGNIHSENTVTKATAPAPTAAAPVVAVKSKTKAKAPDGSTTAATAVSSDVTTHDVTTNDATTHDVTVNDITASDLTGDTTTGDGTVKKKRRWWKK